MPYAMKPLTCDPEQIKGMSERLIISHYENNYGGAVRRLNLIEEKLTDLDFKNAPGFLLNGLKREQLVAIGLQRLLGSEVARHVANEQVGLALLPTGLSEAVERRLAVLRHHRNAMAKMLPAA